MSDKLTCKMSDGTEWEVVSISTTTLHAQLNFKTVAHLKPMKREPREWWTILFSPDDNPIKLQGPVRFETKEKAEQWANQYYKFIQYEAVQVREVIK